MLTMNLPYPISTNRYWRSFKGRTVRSKEANQYKASVKALTLNQEALNGAVAVSVVLLPKLTIKGEASKVIMDLDNSLKVLLDALQGIVYADDAQVKRITAEYGDPVKNGGVMITIEGYEV